MAENDKPTEPSQKTEPLVSASQARKGGVIVGPSPAQRRWRAVGITFGTVFCLGAMAAGTTFGHFYWGSGTFQEEMNKHGFDIVKSVLSGRSPLDTWTPDQQYPGTTALNVLILGCDHDYDNQDRVVWNTPGRSDSILLARVDFVNKTIRALTIPRDSAVHIPDHPGVHKINAAHSIGGPQLSMETIESVFGVKPDAYVELNFEGFQQIVNAIGGIDVNIEKKLNYDDNWGNLHIHLKPGFQHLNGYQAMGYVRVRHSDSDEMRSKRQHEFLEAMRSKIKSPSTFGALPHVIDVVANNLKFSPNMTRDQLFTLVNFARSLPRENIEVKTLPSFEGPSYVTIYPDESAKLIQEMFFPNQQVALNIDAPDPNVVRSMNAPYERGGGGRRHKRHGRASHEAGEGASQTPETQIVPAGAELNVEDNAKPAPATDGAPGKAPLDNGGIKPDPGGKTDPGTGNHPDKQDRLGSGGQVRG